MALGVLSGGSWFMSLCKALLNQAVCLTHDSSSGSNNGVWELPPGLKGAGELRAQLTGVKHFTEIKWTG